MRAWWLALIRRRLNPATLAHAGEPGNRFSIVRTVGRKTGRVYEAPIITAPTPGGRMVELTYGPTVNWYRNARAAGGCEIVADGATYRIVAFEDVSAEVGRSAFAPFERVVLRILRRRHFVRFLGEPVAGDSGVRS